MLPHVFHGFVQGFTVEDLVKVIGKVEAIPAAEAPQLSIGLLLFRLSGVGEEIIKGELPAAFAGEMIDACADQPDRLMADLFEEGNGFLINHRG